ncbi:unnamed protein product [Enterobius vermicularis]|uniref:Uncharacterized protein n=1 Tax=Enterobius vermicularis TaxID=51028 RepID=A0A0N4VIR6_ENTVE|nr:unnamed protein product [Enterobius vermicularis]
MISADGTLAPNTLTTLPPPGFGPLRMPTTQTSNRLDSSAASLSSPSSAGSTIPTPIAVNHTPSKDAKLVPNEKVQPSTSVSVATARSTASVANTILQRQNNSETLTPSTAVLPQTRNSLPAPPTIPQMSYTSPLSTLNNQIQSKTSSSVTNNLLSTTFSGNNLTNYNNGLLTEMALSNSALLQNNAAAYLLQQQQSQILSNANLGGLLGTQLAHSQNIINNVTPSNTANLIPSMTNTNSFVAPVPSLIGSDVLRQYQHQQQQHQNLNSLQLNNPTALAPDLLSVYKLLLESSGLQNYQTQLKKIENPTAFLSPNAGITT